MFQGGRRRSFACEGGMERLFNSPLKAHSRTPSETPAVAPWRMNLTALSQRYNLYFAVYGDQLHVTVPRGLKQKISCFPDLMVDLPVSTEALHVMADIDLGEPHYVNHLIIGNLGDQEIILISCDDGDVIAYYTHMFQNMLQASIGFDRYVGIDPVLHENVGRSAWGLAIHEKSRLIAVGSNRREITIFGLAVHPKTSLVVEASLKDKGSLSIVEKQALSKTELFSRLSTPPKSALHGRETGYRISFNLGDEGHNIPTLSFASNVNGEAQEILVGDIRGNLWMFDIWTKRSTGPPLEIVASPEENPIMSWGVLVLPLGIFKVESTPQKALGLKDVKTACRLGDREIPESYIDISDSKKEIEDMSMKRSSLISSGADNFKMFNLMKAETMHITEFLSLHSEERPQDSESIDSYVKPFRVWMNSPDSPMLRIGTTWNTFSAQADALQKLEERGVEFSLHKLALSEAFKRVLPDGSAILRTYDHDIELIPPNATIPRTVCHIPFRPRTNRPLAQFSRLAQLSRFNMLAVIPELSLVVVASQSGYAALITLTRLEDGFSQFGPVTTFRLEHFVPFSNHEKQIPSPKRALMGIAASPVPSSRSRSETAYPHRNRWRLIMHYVDHTILSYDLSRYENDNLMIL